MDAKTKAIVVAGGRSSRMKVDGRQLDKIFLRIAGAEAIVHTLRAFQESELTGEIILVLPHGRIAEGWALVERQRLDKVSAITMGGGTRRLSVRNGLAAAGYCKTIAVHDGARLCITAHDIDKGIRELECSRSDDVSGVVAVSPLVDTIKRVDENWRFLETMNRNALCAAHTPQIFYADILRTVHEMYGTFQMECEPTDDGMMVEYFGFKVNGYLAPSAKLKITVPEDIVVAEALLRR
jgi:2-C-methyl-D-erythritol 4-phosphate cytidylyltransferase